MRKENQKEKDTLVDPASVTVLSQIEHEDTSSHNTLQICHCLNPLFAKNLQDQDEIWTIRMAKLEALLTIR